MTVGGIAGAAEGFGAGVPSGLDGAAFGGGAGLDGADFFGVGAGEDSSSSKSSS